MVLWIKRGELITMSITLLTDNHYEEFTDEFRKIKRRLNIITPFLSFPAIERMLGEVNDTVEISLITRFKREDFINGVSNLEALKLLLSKEAKIYAIKDLHTKLYLFDEKSAIIGSANLTGRGLLDNVELSLLFRNEHVIVDELVEYFNKLVNSAQRYIIDNDKINSEIEKIESIVDNRKNKNVNYRNSNQWGVEIGTKEIVEKLDGIQSFIEEKVFEEKNSSDVSYWLKFAGTGEELMDPETIFRESKLADGRITEHSGRRPSGIKEGDVIYLTPLSWDKKSKTPIIVGKAKTKGFREGNEVTEADKNRHGYHWMERWPYYFELFDIQKIEGNINNGVSLNKLLTELQSNFYYSTRGKSLSIQELKSRHYQKSHIKITPYAAKYIDELLKFY